MKNKLITFWEIYYPVILAFISFLYSVTLWFMGHAHKLHNVPHGGVPYILYQNTLACTAPCGKMTKQDNPDLLPRGHDRRGAAINDTSR